MDIGIDLELVVGIVLAISVFVVIRYLPRFVAGVPFLEPSALKSMMDANQDVVVVDVRTPSEFIGGLGHIPGAVNVPVGELESRIESGSAELEMLKEHPILVTCRTENRSPRAARIFKKAGFTKVAVLKGGMARWNRQTLAHSSKN